MEGQGVSVTTERCRTRLLVVLSIVAALSAAAAPVQACACGGMVDLEGYDTTVHGETVILHWDGQTTTVQLQLEAHSDAVEAGLLLPTPAPARAALGESEMFDELLQAVAPRRQDQWSLFGPPLFGLAGSPGDGAGEAPQGVQVVDVQDLGPLEATTLTADDPGALDAWLDEHGYTMSEDFADLVTPYVEEEWAFVAVRLTAEGQALDGALPPLAVTYPSAELVYPMRMSQGASVPQRTRVYVLSEQKVERTDPMTGAGSGAELVFAGRLDAADVDSAGLRELLEDTPYLTAIDQRFSDPAAQVTADFRFAAAADQEPFQRVAQVERYLFPRDVGVFVLALLSLVVVVLVRRTWGRRQRAGSASG